MELLKKLDTRQGLIDLAVGSCGTEDYNPAAPFDFEKMLQRRRNLKKDIELKIQKERQLKAQIQKMQQQMQDGSSAVTDTDLEMTAEEAIQARMRKSQMAQDDTEAQQPPSKDQKIEKMMQSMGWKKGKGLGKAEQGQLNPLVAKKTDSAVGVIVESSISMLGQESEPLPDTYLPPLRSRCLVLEDLVPLSEVDEVFSDEVVQECQKYGHVEDFMVRIF